MGARRSSVVQGLRRRLSAPFEASGASTMSRYKPAMVLCRVSDTISASAMRMTCCHCGLERRRGKPHTKTRSLGAWCTISLSKGISFPNIRVRLATIAYVDILLCSIWAMHKIRQTPTDDSHESLWWQGAGPCRDVLDTGRDT